MTDVSLFDIKHNWIEMIFL